MRVATEYQSGPFRSLAATKLGKDLWGFINEDENVGHMERAADKGHCAVVGIEELLSKRFEKRMPDERVQHMIEHMVDQVMEDKGYEIERQNVTVGSSIFSSGTLYTRPEWQRLYVFQSSKDARQLCVAESCDIENLPSAPGGGQWCRYASFATDLRGTIAYGLSDLSAVREEVRNQGYALRTQERLLHAE